MMLDDASNQCYKTESGKFIIASAKKEIRASRKLICVENWR